MVLTRCCVVSWLGACQVYQTQVILPGNDYTYAIWRNSTGVQACYQGKFGWWVPNILQRAVGTPAPTSTPWTLSSTLYRANFLLQTVTLEWTNAKNSGNYWQPVCGSDATKRENACLLTSHGCRRCCCSCVDYGHDLDQDPGSQVRHHLLHHDLR